MNQEFFKIDNFSCGYKDFHLSEISFAIPKGCFAGIIGPNGSGKTTLFKGISSVLPTRVGKVFLDGKELKKMSLSTRAQNIAIVTQTVDAENISVEEYVLMGRLPYYSRFQFFDSKNDIAIAEKYMKLTDIYQHKDKLMTELSGGEQQRAAIARALTQEPELLLLDEPTSHLDITHQVRILNLIQQLNEEMGLTVLMVIHDLNLASEYCEKLILLNKGKVCTNGTPHEVLDFRLLEEVYQTPVIVNSNPYSGKPVVMLVSAKMIQTVQNKKPSEK